MPGMNWVSTAKYISVSRSTLYRNSWKVSPKPKICDDDLVKVTRRLKKGNFQIGEKCVSAHIKAKGWSVTRERVRKALRIVDPVRTVIGQRLKTKRVKYCVKGPNYLWHIDGNEKLQPFRLYTHGCADGYSRKLIYLHCCIDKKASTPLGFFKSAVQQYGFPKKCRSDKGKENIDIAKYVLKHRVSKSSPYITGKSVHNVRIERLWVEVNKVTLRYRHLFRSLQANGIIDLDNQLHMYALAQVYIPEIQKSLNEFIKQWNGHKIRTANNRTPNDLYLTGNKANVHTVFDDSSEEENLDEKVNEADCEYSIFEMLAREILSNRSRTPLRNLVSLIRGFEALSHTMIF